MQSDILNKLKELAKDDSAFESLKMLFNTIETQVRTKEEHLRLLEKAICNDYDSILITELQLEEPGPKIVYVNQGFTTLTGYSKEEVIGKTPRILQGPKTERATLDRLVQSLKEGRSFFGQAVNYRKDGSEFINQWDIHPLYNDSGEITHWVSYQHDITKRKTAEKAFVETETEFDDLTEHSNRILVDVRLDGTIIQANKAFRAISGYEKADLEQHNFIDFVSDSSKNSFLDLIKHAETQLKAELSLLTKKKQTVLVEAEKEWHHVQTGEFIRFKMHNLSLQKKVLETLEQRFANLGGIINKKKEFRYEIIFDADGKPQFVYLSDGFEQLTGFSRDKFVNKPSCSIIFDADDQEKALEQWSSVKNGIDKVEELHLISAADKSVKILNYAQLNLMEKENGKIKICGSMVLVEN